MKRFLLSLQFVLLTLLVASQPTQLFAQADMDLKPGIVVSIANVDEHLNDVEHLMEVAGFGQMSGLVRMGASEYIRGIDTKKPIGALIFFSEDNPEQPGVMAFIPVKDIEDVLDTLAPFVDIDEDGDDIILTMNDGTELTTRVSGDYAFMVQDADMLKKLPEDPANLLGDLPKEYGIAASVMGQNIPESLKNQAIELIKSGDESEMGNLGDGPEADVQRENLQVSMAQLESLINDTEELMIGAAINADTKSLYIDVHLLGTAGSELAKQCNQSIEGPASRFPGFVLDNATASVHYNAKSTEANVEQVEQLLKTFETTVMEEIKDSMPEDAPMSAEDAQKVVTDLFDVARGAVASGQSNAAGSLVLEDGSLSFVAAAGIAEGAKLEEAVKQIAKWVEQEKAPVKFEFDVDTKDGVRYHKITVPVPNSEEEATKVFGDKIEILLGVGDDVVYIALDSDPRALLDKCINAKSDSPKNVVANLGLRLIPILKFASEVQGMPELDGVADILPEGADDSLSITNEVVENGFHLRFGMSDAILKVLATIGQESMGGGGFAPQDF